MTDNVGENAKSHTGSLDPSRSASILEDASTLLMFHNSAITVPDPATKPKEGIKAEPKPSTPPELSTVVTITSQPKPSLTPPTRLPNLSSPGPAIAALSGSNNQKEGSSNSKAVVAAAALAAAASMPMLINRANQDLPLLENSQQPKLENLVAEKIKEASTDSQTNEEESKSADDDKTDINDEEDEDIEEETLPVQPEQPMDEATEETATKTTKPKRSKKKVSEASNPQAEAVSGERFTRKLSEYAVDPDSGIISCICEVDDDDGYTIQCDKCFRWQHIYCMGIGSIDDAPDDFLCNACQPRELNVKRARTHQHRRINAMKSRKDKRGKHVVEEEEAINDPTNDAKDRTNDKKDDEGKTKETTKPRNNKPLNPYGKNLDESDIEVLPPKDQYKTTYYPLKDYDYQDKQVLNYIKTTQSLSYNSMKITKSQFDLTNFPSIKVKSYSEVNNKKFNGISKVGLFTEDLIPQGTFIGEYLGEIGFKSNYIQDSKNHYRIWGVEKPNVLFVPGTEIVIDARFSGNITRFIRRSCHPNCELIPVKVGEHTKFMLNSLKPIKSGTELTVAWNWDNNHPIKYITDGKSFDATNDADKPTLVLSIESILTFVECACTTATECALFKVKKASSHIYRATRKGNASSGLKLLKKESEHFPIQGRLLEKERLNILDAKEMGSVAYDSSEADKENADVDKVIEFEPYIYSYATKRRKLLHVIDPDDQNTLKEYLPIPVENEVQQETKPNNDINDSVSGNMPSKTVKKLSFADYYKKKKNPV